MMNATNLSMVMIGVFGGVAVAALIFYMYKQSVGKKKKDEATKEAERIVQRAKSQASKVDRESKKKAKDFETRARRNVENDIRKQKQGVENTEKQLKDKLNRLDNEYKQKQSRLDQKIQSIDDKREKISIAEERIQKLEQDAESRIVDLNKKLEVTANLSTEEAARELKDSLMAEAEKEIASELSKVEKDAKEEARAKARRVLVQAVARYASEVSTERTVTTIAISGEEMKGKIIGREGRNIRALESCCGVDVVIDESPDSVIISSFDPVRREVARRSIERLIEDGRVHPARIEEVTDKIKQEMVAEFTEEGEKACVDLGVIGVKPGLQSLLGQLKYRATETQNMYQHSLEVGFIAGLIAGEIGFDVQKARRAGLLHDIGRAVDHTVAGSHSQVGADVAKKFGESREITDAIRSHEEDEGVDTRGVLGQIVQAANNLSKARPGARRDQMENYVQRLQDLESVANSFDGVDKTFAVQSGKEVRVIVDSSKVTDEQSMMLSRDIARKIQRELNYPGQVKVAVIRQTRIVEHAR